MIIGTEKKYKQNKGQVKELKVQKQIPAYTETNIWQMWYLISVGKIDY